MLAFFNPSRFSSLIIYHDNRPCRTYSGACTTPRTSLRNSGCPIPSNSDSSIITDGFTFTASLTQFLFDESPAQRMRFLPDSFSGITVSCVPLEKDVQKTHLPFLSELIQAKIIPVNMHLLLTYCQQLTIPVIYRKHEWCQFDITDESAD
jgi:hypothetical protein